MFYAIITFHLKINVRIINAFSCYREMNSSTSSEFWNENHGCKLKGWRWQKWDPCAILSALKCLQHVRRSWERQNRISLFLSLHGWSFFTISPRVLCWNENDCRAISNIICGREISALRLDLFRSHAWKKSHGIVVKWLPKDLPWINKWSVPSLSCA